MTNHIASRKRPTMSSAFQQLHTPVMIVDADNNIHSINKHFSKISGFIEEEVIGQALTSICDGQLNISDEGLQQVIIKTKSQSHIPQLVTLNHFYDELTKERYIIHLFFPCDQCGIDPLTKLPNRNAFERSMKSLIREAQKEQSLFALLFIDLDRFKFVNDTLGHSSGDSLLIQFTQRLKDILPSNHLLTRVGGDEFICVIKNLSSEKQAEDIGKLILKSFQEAFLIREIEIFLTASIGISFFPYDGDNLEILTTNADSAMYRAKKKGKNQIENARVEMNAGSFEKLLIENHLRKSIENDELFLEFQPQMDIKNNVVVAFEALVRWNHPELGIVPPGDFIPIAEETGLIIPIGEWVIKNACKKIHEWNALGYNSIRVSVNLSVQEFLQKDIVEKIYKIVKEYDVDPSQLELEVTESMFMHDLQAVIKILNELRTLGFTISIDDFGTGFSSLSYLQKLPVNNLKIDRSFIKDIDTNLSSKRLTDAITTLAHDLKLGVIVEGVETLNQLVHVKKSACDMVQGFYFSKPLAANHVVDFLESQGKIKKIT